MLGWRRRRRRTRDGWVGCVGGVEESTFCLAGLGAGYAWLSWQRQWWWQRIGRGHFCVVLSSHQGLVIQWDSLLWLLEAHIE